MDGFFDLKEELQREGISLEELRQAIAAIRNLRGDGDMTPEGKIRIGWESREMPVVRFEGELPEAISIPTEDVNVVTGLKFLVNGNNLEVQLQTTPVTVLAKGTAGEYAADANTRVALVTKRVVVRDGLKFDSTLTPGRESINLHNKFSDIKVVAAGADTQSSLVTLKMRTQDIVESSTYDDTTHQFVNRTTQALVPDNGESAADTTVFTATAHSAETAQQE